MADSRKTTVNQTLPRKTRAEQGSGFPIVALGASAGGLPALEEVLRNMPPDTGMAFVIATHQHPEHTSLLPELLGKCTQMQVAHIKRGMRLEPNRVYVAPGQPVEIRNGKFALVPEKRTPEAGVRLPIDHLFRSLAAVNQDRAIGIVLSGTGTDGTLGLKAIKAKNGLTIAQLPESAKYPGMPRSAIDSNIVDYVLPPDKLGEALADYVNGPYFASTALRRPVKKTPAISEGHLDEIFDLLQSRTRHDFSDYKANTLKRRIERRMNVHNLARPAEYVRFLKANIQEIDILFKELLINVTSFFRDPQAFEVLRHEVLPVCIRAFPRNYTMRIWVPGCSTGEEVYSLLIVVKECAEEVNRHIKIQVFGSDLDLDAINAARAGIYPDGIAADISPERLRRFFVRRDNGYQISRELREAVVFADHNVARDPPFTKLDLLSCRNLLIYLNSRLQKRLLSLFLYALKPKGILFLGSSETLGGAAEGFEEISSKWKIFRRNDEPNTYASFADFSGKLASHTNDSQPANIMAEPSRLAALAADLLLDRYAPPSLLVNERGDILYIHGRTGAYLEPASGQPRLNVQEMARQGLRLELTSALRQAGARNEEVRRSNIRVKANGNDIVVNLTVRQLEHPLTLRGLFLITFQPSSQHTSESKKHDSGSSSRQPRVTQLETELQETQENLQSTIEELETSNEELTSTNEELQSTNEELQSTNEELETSKEEMQSLNEELTTVNTELEEKVRELSQVTDDMTNLLNSTNIATLFLDTELRIKRFTPQTVNMIKLIDTDVGRPIEDLMSNLAYEALADDGREVLQSLTQKEAEVQTIDGCRYLMRILPYRTSENVVDGLVYTFVDIDRMKAAERSLAESGRTAQPHRNLLQSIARTVKEPFLVLDRELRIVFANSAFYKRFVRRRRSIEGIYFHELEGGEWNVPRLQKRLQRMLAGGSSFENFESEHAFSRIGRRTVSWNGCLLEKLADRPLILLTLEDVTEESA